MLNNILEYQRIDARIVAIEKEIADSPSKKVVNQMVDYVKAAQQKLVQIEKNANTLILEYEELRNQFEKNTNVVEKLSKQKFENKNNEELKTQADIVAQTNIEILNIEKNISALSKKINTILQDFDKTKQQGNIAKKNYEQGMVKYNDFVKSKQVEIDKLKKELVSIESGIDAKILTKYKQLRGDKKFPIFVPLVGNSCGGCSMELPSSKLDKLKQAGMLECENCHRIIYKKD